MKLRIQYRLYFDVASYYRLASYQPKAARGVRVLYGVCKMAGNIHLGTAIGRRLGRPGRNIQKASQHITLGVCTTSYLRVKVTLLENRGRRLVLSPRLALKQAMDASRFENISVEMSSVLLGYSELGLYQLWPLNCHLEWSWIMPQRTDQPEGHR